jgi:hypothetical protein
MTNDSDETDVNAQLVTEGLYWLVGLQRSPRECRGMQRCREVPALLNVPQKQLETLALACGATEMWCYGEARNADP